MSVIRRLFCRHSHIEIVRAHPESPIGKEHGHLSVWKDTHAQLNLLRCERCGTYLKGVVKERLFGTATTMDEGVSK